MQNPFTTTFSKTPEYTYIHTEKTEEILENFIYDNPSESVYKICLLYTSLAQANQSTQGVLSLLQ